MKRFIIVLLSLLVFLAGSYSQEKEGMFKIALIQMYVDPGNKKVNLENAERLIKEAAVKGAKVVLLPEAMNLGWTHHSALNLADEIPGGESCSRLMKAARNHKLFICSGMVERDGNLVYNSAVIIDDAGKLLIRHRKINELDIAHDIYSQGDRLNVCHTPFGTFGLLICADAFARDLVLTRSLCLMGADVILSPSSWAVSPDHDNLATPYGETWREAYIPVAKEFSVWIAGCSNVGPVTEGPWKNWKTIGCSLVIDAGGKEIIQGPYGDKAETIIYVDIKPVRRTVRGSGWNNIISPE
jgi:predicted amidohydrolase